MSEVIIEITWSEIDESIQKNRRFLVWHPSGGIFIAYLDDNAHWHLDGGNKMIRRAFTHFAVLPFSPNGASTEEDW